MPFASVIVSILISLPVSDLPVRMNLILPTALVPSDVLFVSLISPLFSALNMSLVTVWFASTIVTLSLSAIR